MLAGKLFSPKTKLKLNSDLYLSHLWLTILTSMIAEQEITNNSAIVKLIGAVKSINWH